MDVIFAGAALGLELRQRPGQPVVVHATHGASARAVPVGSTVVAIAGEAIAALSLAAVQSRIGAAERPLTLRFRAGADARGSLLPRVYGPRWQYLWPKWILDTASGRLWECDLELRAVTQVTFLFLPLHSLRILLTI